MDFMKPETALDLNNIRAALIRMEDTILFDLIERAQFYLSSKVYDKGVFESLNGLSFLDWMLQETEKTHSRLRRYQCPDENPFYPEVMENPVLPSLSYPQILAENHRDTNVNHKIKDFYIKHIVPNIAANKGEQPENYGSCTLSDIQALQALSRRIHFGKFVAESKFHENKEKMIELIKAKDADGILNMISKPEVEKTVLERVRSKAEKYTVDPHTSLRWSHKTQGKANPDVIVDIYENCIIPLTKEVEVDYLLHRLEVPY